MLSERENISSTQSSHVHYAFLTNMQPGSITDKRTGTADRCMFYIPNLVTSKSAPMSFHFTSKKTFKTISIYVYTYQIIITTLTFLQISHRISTIQLKK